MEIAEMLIVFVVVGLFLKAFIYDPFINYWPKGLSTYEKVLFLLKSPDFQMFLIVLVILSLVILSIWIYIKQIKKATKKRKKEERLGAESSLISELIDEKIEGFDSSELEDFIHRFNSLYLLRETKEKFAFEIKNKLIHAVDLLEKKLHNEELNRYLFKKQKIIEETDELRRKRHQEILKSDNKKQIILGKLNIEENIIYEKVNLRPEEIEILKEEDFKEVNEYDPIEKKNMTFLVKQILNHSPSHTFLVARIKQLLEKYISHRKIRTHDTKDADLTFEVKYKIYAFEIETGTLIAKKKSLRNKVSLLNNKYGQNWYFIVTNRNLAKEYRKYGKVTSRMGVCKIIEKLVKD